MTAAQHDQNSAKKNMESELIIIDIFDTSWKFV